MTATPQSQSGQRAGRERRIFRRPLGFWLRRMLLYVVLSLLTVIFIAPFVWLLSNSLKNAADAFNRDWIPNPVEWRNYIRIFEAAPLLLMIRNSVVVAMLAVTAVAVSSSMVAFALARLRFPGSNVLFLAVLGSMMLPGAVTMVPVYLIYHRLGMVNTLYPLWFSNLFGSAFYIFMLRQFFLTIPQDIVEAGRIDGANFYRIFFTLMLPLIAPAMLSVAIFEFQASWNNFMGPLIYIQRPSLRTLPLGLQLFVQHLGTGGQMRWELLFAASVLMTLPTVILFFLVQNAFIEGIATTGLKG
ncbi:MAG: carbohydrate ABC transporter permease [Anaerolineae bacterium]